MADIIYNFFKYFTNVPVNFWLWLLPITAPLLVFTIKPAKSLRVRIGILFLAVILTYILINLSLHTHRVMDLEMYQACQNQFTDGDIQHHKECGTRNIADGASAVFYLFFGWIPAIIYVGLLEWLRRRIKDDWRISAFK